MANREDNDSDAPEEFTAEQGILRDEEIRKIQRESKSRVAQARKEQRRKRAQMLQRKKKAEVVEDEKEIEEHAEEETPISGRGMLPSNIVDLLAAREKQVFESDPEEEGEKRKEKKSKSKKKRANKSGIETVILNEVPTSHCVERSLEFLKKRKMQVSRSSAVLSNSNQALRLISTSGLLK